MELYLYHRCQTKTKRAMRHRGRKFNYVPKHDLILRLMEQVGWSYAQIRERLMEESKYLRTADEIET